MSPVIPTVVAEDSATARKGAAWVTAFYLTTMGPIYRDTLIRYGYKSEVEAVLEANAGARPSIVPPEAEAMLEQLALYGTPEEVCEKLELWKASGATMPTFMLNPNLALEDISFSIGAFDRFLKKG